MTRLRSLIKEVLSQPKKKDCNCGCNDCGGKAPILTEGKVKHLISEGLQYHMDKKIQLHESIYRIGSEKHFELIREARALWVRGIINVSEDDQAILETNLGHFGMYEGEVVPLDMPMVNEEKKLTYADFVQMVRDDMKAGAAGDEYASEKQIERVARYKYDDYQKGVSVDDLFEESLNEAKMPSQEEVDKFFSITQNEMHYLNSKPVMGQKGDRVRREIEPWDEYDLSNWNALVRRAKAQGKINEENKPSRINSLIKLVKSAKNPRNLPISFGTTSVAIGGTQYDKGELVDMFNGRELGMDSIDIRKVFYNAQQDAKDIADEVNASNSGIKATIGYGYGKRPILYLKKSSLNEVHKLLRQTNLSSEEYQKAKKLKGFNTDDYTFSSDNNLYVKKSSLDEKKKAKSKKKDPPIGKPKRGGSKAYYVYVRDPKTKRIKKVSFGSGGLRAKIRNPKARKAFAARHKCSQKTDRTKPSYWSCRLPRYAKQLGLGSNMNTFW